MNLKQTFAGQKLGFQIEQWTDVPVGSTKLTLTGEWLTKIFKDKCKS